MFSVFSMRTNTFQRLNVLLVARCLLVFARCSLLFAHCSLNFARCSLLVSFHSLLVTFCSLLVTFCSLLVSFYSWLVRFCQLLMTFCSLLIIKVLYKLRKNTTERTRHILMIVLVVSSQIPERLGGGLVILVLQATARLLVTRVSLIYLVDEFFMLSFLMVLKEIRTRGSSRFCCFCFWCKSRKLGGRDSPRLPCVTPVVKSFSSDALRALISY